jgi:hypothetical protein
MKKHLFFLPFLLVLQVHGAAPQPSLFDLGIGDDDNDTYFSIRSLQEQACDIRMTLQACRSIPPEYAQEVSLIITKLSNIKLSPAEIHSIKQAVRRYEVLANACQHGNLDSTTMSPEVAEIVMLLEERARIITEIHRVVNPMIHSHLILQTLPSILGHEPSTEEKADFAQQHRQFVADRRTEQTALEKELFEVEKQILSDRRTSFEKYFPLAMGTATLVGALIGAGALYNYMNRTAPEKTDE